jgi:exosortase D (VPLPA-CTERM-specific)
MKPIENTAAINWPHDKLAWAGVLTVVFIVAYWAPLRGIVNTWATNDDYSYGYLIPFISAYLFWDMRHKLNNLAFKPAWAFLPLLLIFVGLSLYGVLGSSGNIARPAVPLVFILLITFCFGIETLKRFALPLGFLIFLVPLPAILDRTIGVFLKSISSKLGGYIIQLSGLSVHVSGNIIDLGVTQLQVVDACSGLRFVFPLLALGVIYAYLFEKMAWKRVVCVVATVPIAIFTNVLRIASTGILTHFFGPKMAEGFFHDFSGWIIFMVAFFFLFILSQLLKLVPQPQSATLPPKTTVTATSPSPDAMRSITPALLTSLTILMITGALTLTTSALPPVKLKGGIAAFPLAINKWFGKPQFIDQAMINASGAQEAFQAFYRKGQDERVSLYIGYRGASFLENENFFHSPTVCLPSSGWKSLEESTHQIKNVDSFGKLEVTKMIIEQMGVKQLVYFWFQTKDKATHDKNINRFHLAIHALKRDNTHDLFIRTITPIASGEALTDAEDRMDAFIREMMVSLNLFLARQIEMASQKKHQAINGVNLTEIKRQTGMAIQ